MKHAHPIIAVCSSAAFYQHVIELQNELQALGLGVIIPKTARLMSEKNDFDVSHYKTWFANADDYGKKAALIRAHFDEITRSDAILVVNDEKHGVPNYIGGNVLMEMALAFHLKKPIFILNDYSLDTPLDEEIRGLLPIVLRGDLSGIRETLVTRPGA